MLSAYVLDLLNNPVTIRVEEGTNSSRCADSVSHESGEYSGSILTISLLSPIQVWSNFSLQRLENVVINYVLDDAASRDLEVVAYVGHQVIFIGIL